MIDLDYIVIMYFFCWQTKSVGNLRVYILHVEAFMLHILEYECDIFGIK